MTIDAGVFVTIARPDIIAGQPERKSSWPYILHMASGETVLMWKDALVELTGMEHGTNMCSCHQYHG